MQLSIIVPVYNVEPYVEKCLRSLMNQDIDHCEYEVIVINDGSPDNSREIIINLQKEFNNIILIDQENQGVSVARNNGITIAKGRFILCVDPDDYILPNTLRNVLLRSHTENLDVLYLSFTILNEKGQPKYDSSFNNLVGKHCSGVDTYFISRGPKVKDPDRSWAIIYSSAFLRTNQLNYPEGVPYLEDGLFLAKLLCLAQRCSFDSTPFYQRTIRPGSATHSKLIFSEYAQKGFIKAAIEIRSFGQTQNLNRHQRELINQAVAKFVLLPLQSCATDKNYTLYKEITYLLRENGFFQLDLDGCMSIYAHLGKIYNFSILLLYYYYWFFTRYKYLLSLKLGGTFIKFIGPTS